MRKFMLTAAAAALALSTVAAGQQQSPPDGYQGEMTVASGETVNYTGDAGTGGTTALSLFGLNVTDPADCGTASENKCDKILVEFTGSGEASFDLAAAYPPADFDVHVFESDADGTRGEEVASSGNFYFPVAQADAGLAPNESATFEVSRGFYALEVHYYAAGGGYSVDVSLA